MECPDWMVKKVSYESEIETIIIQSPIFLCDGGKVTIQVMGASQNIKYMLELLLNEINKQESYVLLKWDENSRELKDVAKALEPIPYY